LSGNEKKERKVSQSVWVMRENGFVALGSLVKCSLRLYLGERKVTRIYLNALFLAVMTFAA
jgi:hypothetical protein